MNSPSRLAALAPLLLIVALSAPSAGGALAAREPLPPGLEAAIRTVHPQARLVGPEDINSNECGEQMRPGLVAGDFDGDGHMDYAAWLRTRIAKRVTTRTLHNGGQIEMKFYDSWSGVFWGEAGGRFRAMIEPHRGELATPNFSIMAPLPAGEVQVFDGPILTLNNPGYQWVVCGKAAMGYYWDGKSFQEITTAD